MRAPFQAATTASAILLSQYIAVRPTRFSASSRTFALRVPNEVYSFRSTGRLFRAPNSNTTPSKCAVVRLGLVSPRVYSFVLMQIFLTSLCSWIKRSNSRYSQFARSSGAVKFAGKTNLDSVSAFSKLKSSPLFSKIAYLAFVGSIPVSYTHLTLPTNREV